ncbi:MAG: YceI family protein [Planctomycetota bacterium]
MRLNRPLGLQYLPAIALVLALWTPTFAQESQLDQNAAEFVPVAAQPAVMIDSSNSRISFVGIHVGDEPKPRLGGFTEFQGYVAVDAATSEMKSMVVDIQMDSIWTEFVDLTTHLKNADFFDVASFPSARFVSTEIVAGENGACTVNGNLTLHGQTAPVSLEGEFRMADGALMFRSRFSLDRSEFGMTEMLSGVDAMVQVELAIGQPTITSDAQEGHGGDSSEAEEEMATRQISLALPNMT